MLFTVKERILLLGVLPPTSGSALYLRIIRKLREDLSFSEDEAAALNIHEQDGMLLFNNGPEKEIEVGPVAVEFIAKSLREMDQSGRLSEDSLGLFERFVEAPAVASNG